MSMVFNRELLQLIQRTITAQQVAQLLGEMDFPLPITLLDQYPTLGLLKVRQSIQPTLRYLLQT